MDSFSLINLIQAGTFTVAVLGCLMFWRVNEFRGLSLLLALIAFASLVNILEEANITRDFYLISPIFIMLFGPATYLAALFAIEKRICPSHWWHLFPVLPLLLFTSHVHAVIAIGSVWRVAYTLLTVHLLTKYKKRLESERSDSDDFSLNWLMWLLITLVAFNFIDLIRLNLQHIIALELNLLGQGINNFVWLFACMVIVSQFAKLDGLPNHQLDLVEDKSEKSVSTETFGAIFEELDKLMKSHQWYLKPRITLTDLSELTGLQTRDISRAINLFSDQSFNDYINQFRVKAVCEALTHKQQQSMTDIAFDAGFSSKASFNKVFKDTLGVTPSEYKAGLKSRH